MNLNDFYKPLPDIGIFAKTRSGKDEIFKILYGMGFHVERVAFGDVMKERFFETFPHIPREPKPIEQQIAYGEAMRQIDTHVWVRPTMNRKQMRADLLSQAGLKVPTFVYTDIRNMYEYEAVKQTGAIMLKVEADTSVRVSRMLELGETPSEFINNSPTERLVDTFEYDYRITNNGTRKELEQTVTDLVFQIQQKRNDD